MIQSILCLVLAVSAQELVTNGSFKKGDKEADGWNFSNAACVSWSRGGKTGKGIHLSTPPETEEAASWTQEIKGFKPDTLHVFSCWVRASAPATARVILSGLKFYGDGQNPFTVEVGDKEWRFWRFPVVGTGASDENVTIRFHIDPGESSPTLTFDDVSLIRYGGIDKAVVPVGKASVPAEAAEEGNLISNGRFEIRDISKPAGWVHHDPSFYPRTADGKFLFDPAREKARCLWEDGGFGGRSLSIAVARGAGWGGWCTQARGVEPKTDYVLEFWFRMLRGDGLVVQILGRTFLIEGKHYDPTKFWRWSINLNSGEAEGDVNVGFMTEAWNTKVSKIWIDRVRLSKKPSLPAGESEEEAAARKKAGLAALREKADALLVKAGLHEGRGEAVEACRAYRRTLSDYDVLVSEELIDPDAIRESWRKAGFEAVIKGLKSPAPSRDKHVDPVYGLEFSPPSGWQGVPPRPTTSGLEGDSLNRACVYFYPDVPDLSLTVYRSGKAESIFSLARAASLRVAELSKGARGGFETTPVRARGLKGSSRTITNDGLGDRFHVIHLWHPRDGGAVLILAWRGVWTEKTARDLKAKAAREKAWRALEGLNVKVAAKFKLYSGPMLAAYRKRHFNRAFCAGWKERKSKHYVTRYAGEAAAGQRVADRLEELHDLYRELAPAGKRLPPAFVNFFADRASVEIYDSGSGTLPARKDGDNLVAYPCRGGRLDVQGVGQKLVADERVADRIGFGMLARNAFEHYVNSALEGRRGGSPPPWILPGLADCFSASRAGADGIEFDVHESLGPAIAAAVSANAHVPLREFLAYRPVDVDQRAALCRAEAWALARFLISSEKASYRKLIPTLLTRMEAQGEDYRTATDQAVRNLSLDYDKLEADFTASVAAAK